ncbi:MAG: hypothetical protein ACYDBW_08140, partial [Sulfuricaulis sp.]
AQGAPYIFELIRGSLEHSGYRASSGSVALSPWRRKRDLISLRRKSFPLRRTSFTRFASMA